MKKKILALCLVVVLAVTAVTGATLAYFTDTEKATNTMVIGDIEINIDEYQYDSEKSKWEKFEDEEFILYPLENEQGIYLYNKSVRTYNDTTVPANKSADDYKVYIRSFALIEKNTLLEDSYVNGDGVDCCFPGIHVTNATNEKYVFSVDGTTQYGSKEAGHLEETVTVDGKEYWVIWYVVYDETTAIGVNEALHSLHSVHMDKNINNEQAKGWGDDGVQVIAFSQAIQATGLTHDEAMEALGEVTVEYLEDLVDDADDAVINDFTM